MLARYLLRLLAVRVAATLAVLTVIYALFDLGEAGRQLAASLGWPTILAATALRLPSFAAQLLPAALILGGALTLAALHRRGELEALATLGAGPGALGRPLLLFGLLSALAGWALGEGLAPTLEAHADRLYRHQRRSSLTGKAASTRDRWQRRGAWLLRVERPLRAASAAPRRPRVLALKVGRGLQLERRIDGHLGSADHRGVLHDVREVRLGAGQARLERRPSRALPALATLRHRDSGRAESQGLLALAQRAHRERQDGRSTRMTRVLLHLRLSFPLLALPAALWLWALALRRGAALPLAAAFLALSWLLAALGFLSARSGLVAAFLGPWGALSLATTAALLMLWRRWPRARI
ncbi:MAG: hypothetical protein CSA65_06930 [Proteobacteria bacterium]|nr:MAG: hypothetical protein CSB49_05425 [Pseudomonadota bacterium]PIE17882.1 MAG: hypothetical protein CSA65_06930 [Pseudomonadota bacterium]